MWDEPIGSAFGFDLFGGFAEGERLSLREDVGEQKIMMTAETV
jgi:hypothetical protein